MDGTNLKNIASKLELTKRRSVPERFGETHVLASRFSQPPKWEIHAHSEEDLVGPSEGLKIVIWDKTESKTIVLTSGDAAILPHNTWHSPLPNDEVSLRNMGDYAGTVVSDKDGPHQKWSARAMNKRP